MMSNTYDSVLREAAKKGTSVFSFKKTYPAYIVLVLALAASVIVWKVVSSSVEASNRGVFDKASASVVSRIETQVRDHEGILKSMEAVLKEFPVLTRDVFELYASIPTKTRTTIQSVTFAEYVTKETLDDFIFFAQSERFPYYDVHPKGNKPFYFPAFYVMPLEQNSKFQGFDLSTDNETLKAIEECRDAKKLTSTGEIQLRKPDLHGFRMFMPVFKDSTKVVASELKTKGLFKGVIMLEVLAHEMFRVALSQRVATDTAISFTILDTVGTGKEIYSSANFKKDFIPTYSQTFDVKIGNKAFNIQVHSIPGFGASNLPLLAFIGSVITSLLLFAFTISILTARSRAEDLAERATRSQRRIVDTSQDLIGVIGIDGVWKSINGAVQLALSMNPEIVVGKSFYDMILDDDKAKVMKVISEAKDEESTTFDVRMPSSRGETRWISWNITVSKTDGLMYAIGRDVTEAKLAQEQIRIKGKQLELSQQYTVEMSSFQSLFLSDASFFFRTELTGIIGYLQLLAGKVYSSEQEHDEYTALASESAEAMLSRVSDLLDVAQTGTSSMIDFENVPLSETITHNIEHALLSVRNPNVTTLFSTNGVDTHLLSANKSLLTQAFDLLISSLLTDVQSGTIDVNVEINSYEQVAELQLLFPPSDSISAVIDKLQLADHSKTLINLASDTDDVILKIAQAQSKIKMQRGTLSIDSLGKDGNVVMITLPAKKIAARRRKVA